MSKKMDKNIDNFFSKILKNTHNKQVTSQNYIPVEYIKDGIIKLKGSNEYRSILKVNALNFFTKNAEEKNAIIHQFGVFLDGAKESIQIVTQSKTLNMKETLNGLKDKFNKSDSENLKEYIAIYGNLLHDLSEDSNVLTKDFFLIVKYSAKEEETFLNISKSIKLTTQKVSKSLEGCSLTCNLLNDNEVYQVLYLFYNKDKSKFQSLADQDIHNYMTTALSLKQTKQEEYNFDFMRPQRVQSLEFNNVEDIGDYTGVLDKGIVSVEDIISSDDIEIEKDHLIINNRYVRTIFISGILKNECYPEWLSDIYTYPANIDVSIHISHIPKKEALDDLTKKYNYQLAALQEVAEKGKILSEMDKNDASELDYLRKLISGNQEMYYLSFYISLSAESLDDLNDLTLEIESMLGNKQILSRRASLSQLSAFNSILPIGLDTIKYYRNIPTEALSTFFPFTNSELSCTKGKPILYGANLLTGSLIIFDKFNPPDSSITNYNTIICGAAGSGKSFATKLEIMRRFIEGTKIIGIDPNSEYEGVVSRCGGQYVSVGGGAADKINIFEISFYKDPITGKVPNLLNDKIMNLHSIFRMMFQIANEPYTAQIFNTIERALKDVYYLKGITDDPATLFRNNKIVEGNINLARNLFKEVPTLSDFKYVLLERYGDIGEHIINNVLYAFIDGAFNIFNGQSTIDISNSMLFFDIKDCNDALKPLVYLVLCEFIWEKVKRKPKKENAMFIVDEAWIMMKNEYTAKFLAEFARQDRKFNVGLSCVTQQAEDFFRDDWGYGKTIYNNTSMHVLMKQAKDDIGIISETYKISDSIKTDLITSRSGYGYMFWGNTYTKIYFIASQEEFSIVNTNPNIG